RELKDYQAQGVRWMTKVAALGLGGILADEMGLGKTVQTIAAHLLRQATPATAGPTLVVAPLSVLNHWKDEITATAPGTPVRVLHGPRSTLHHLEPHAIVLMTYQALPSRHTALLAQRWSMVVADEAQNIKTAHAVWAQRLRSLNSHARFALTGT
ncbi:SNF2-related protein, partial [Streptomyces viridochromogenes]